jgi:hypothetical protein
MRFVGSTEEGFHYQDISVTSTKVNFVFRKQLKNFESSKDCRKSNLIGKTFKVSIDDAFLLFVKQYLLVIEPLQSENFRVNTSAEVTCSNEQSFRVFQIFLPRRRC